MIETTLLKSKYERLVVAVQELSLARDVDTVMNIVKVAARELTGSDGSTFVFRDGDFCFYADEYAIGPLWKGKRFPMRSCISGWVMSNREVAAVEDIYVDPRIPIDAYKPTFVKSLVMVPIRSMSPMGAIGNYWAHRHLPSRDEVRILQSLADLTAVTLENVELYQTLEQKVKERTIQLEQTNNDLQTAIKDLQAFAYSLTHDFKAPLRTMTFTLATLEEEYTQVLDHKAAHLVSRSVKKSEEMNQLLDGLVKIFATGQKEIASIPVPMKEIVREVFDELKQEEQGREITFAIKDIPSAMADPFLIKQVWVNLISNALKYSRKKDHTVITVASEDTKDHVIYRIEDNGTGFDMAYYDKVFAPFQRLHHKEQFDGTGLGLSVAERIIVKHNGRIWAKAELNKGATFFFSLPKIEKPVVGSANPVLY